MMPHKSKAHASSSSCRQLTGTSKVIKNMPPQSLDDVEADFVRKTLRETRSKRALGAEILGQ